MNFELSIVWQQMQETINGFISLLPNLITGLIVFIIFLFLANSLKEGVRRVSKRQHRHRNLGLALGRLTQWGAILIGLLIALTIILPGFSPTGLVSALGVTGIAIGFAFKDIFQNFLAGLLILMTEPFQINDQIIFKDYEGTVEDIQTRATTIKTYDGRRVVIPNAELYTNSVTVNTAFDKRRWQYDIGLGYGDDIERARRVILEAISEVETVLTEPAPDALVVELAESTVKIRARWWIQPPRRVDALTTQDRVLTAIKNKLAENGIDLPFPTRQILFHDQTEEIDGDRSHQREGWPAGQGDVPKPRTLRGELRRVPMQEQNNSIESHK
jgi:small conductance mechanosensitive channel